MAGASAPRLSKESAKLEKASVRFWGHWAQEVTASCTDSSTRPRSSGAIARSGNSVPPQSMVRASTTAAAAVAYRLVIRRSVRARMRLQRLSRQEWAGVSSSVPASRAV